MVPLDQKHTFRVRHGDMGFRGHGDNPLGFGGWDMGIWGLGVGLGDNPLGFGGWDMGTWV